MTSPAASTSPPSVLAPGTLFAGRYLVEALIGWGGQALVYRVADRRQRPGSAVALKVVRADLAADDRAAASAALAWEGRLLQRLNHPALPRAVQLYSGMGGSWLARELIAGPTLAELAAGSACDAAQVLDWALQMCDLLRYLHTVSPPVICGDLKPRNLVLRPDGQLALIDLGAAQTLTRRPPRSPRPRHGTPGYAAPEQLGAWGGDERSDLFSLAVTCYELLTGLDPAHAPLQFDLAALDRSAGSYGPVLRWALSLDRQRRPATAAVLREALAPGGSAQPLVLMPAVRVDNVDDLLRAASRHSLLLEAAIFSGAVERWFASHPSQSIGALLHELRAASGRHRRSGALIQILTPPEGSPQIEVWPDELRFGPLPQRRWRTWLRGQRLTLRNTAATPLRWELEGEQRSDAEVRIWLNGRAQRRAEGVLLPDASAELELVAAGRPGPRQGSLTLRCGAFRTGIPWQGHVQAGLPLGNRVVPRLEDLDLGQVGLVPLLEDLLQRGVLERWLAEQGQRALAAPIVTARAGGPLEPLPLRLLVGALLHQRDPERFPDLLVQPQPWQGQPLPAGDKGRGAVLVINQGSQPCVLSWFSRCPWASIPGPPVTLAPGQRYTQLIALAPPRELPPTPHSVSLELRAAALPLPVALQVPLAPPRWWQRVLDWLAI